MQGPHNTQNETIQGNFKSNTKLLAQYVAVSFMVGQPGTSGFYDLDLRLGRGRLLLFVFLFALFLLAVGVPLNDLT